GDHQSPRREETRSQRPVHRGIHHRSAEDRGRQAGDQRLRPAEVRTMIATRTLIAALAATFLSLSGAAMADTTLPPMISVTGEATVNATPDLAQIDGGVTTDAKTAREASDANNAAMGKVLLALQGAGLAEKDY